MSKFVANINVYVLIDTGGVILVYVISFTLGVTVDAAINWSVNTGRVILSFISWIFKSC